MPHVLIADNLLGDDSVDLRELVAEEVQLTQTAVDGQAEQLSRVVDEAMKEHQAATFSSVVWLWSSVTLMPSLNCAPASTSATSWGPLKRRQRCCAASRSL